MSGRRASALFDVWLPTNRPHAYACSVSPCVVWFVVFACGVFDDGVLLRTQHVRSGETQVWCAVASVGGCQVQVSTRVVERIV